MRTPESEDGGIRLHQCRNSRTSPARLNATAPTWSSFLEVLVNIGVCGKHATSNRNSYVPFRPQKNGRLGAEPDTAIYLEPPGNIPGGYFLRGDGSGFRAFAQRFRAQRMMM